jgi:hypothetical protein
MAPAIAGPQRSEHGHPFLERSAILEELRHVD